MKLLEYLADYERKNGTLACILPQEYEALCKGIMKHSVNSSARREWDRMQELKNAD